MPIRELELAIKNRLLPECPDPEKVGQIYLALQAATQQVGRATAAQPVTLSLSWLEEQTKYPLVNRTLIPKNIPHACQQQVERWLPSDWSASAYVLRPSLASALEEFLQSDRNLFVLIGNSGSGKSWFCADEAAARLEGRVRLLIGGQELKESGSLTDLIHRQLIRFAHPGISSEELFLHLSSAAADAKRGPLVLIADDVPLTNDHRAFEERLASLCREAKDRDVKLVLSARSGIWHRLSAGGLLGSYLFRRIMPLNDIPRYSYELDYLSDDEMRAMLTRLLPSTSNIDHIAIHLRQPAFTALRNPYLLSIYIRQHLKTNPKSTPVPVDIDVLLDEEANRRFNKVKSETKCEPGELASIKLTLIEDMWHARRSGIPSDQLIKSLNKVDAELGRKTLYSLQSEDIITHGADTKAAQGTVTYANPQFGDRLTAKWLVGRLQQGDNIVSEMEAGLDDGVMTALARHAIDEYASDVISWAQRVLDAEPRWLAALSQGLAQRREENWRIPAILDAWSHRVEFHASWHAMRALGTMAGHSAYAQKWVAALYADESELQAFHGQIALGAALNIAPRWTKRHVLRRLYRDLKRPSGFMKWHENEEQARYLRGALQPLLTTRHAEAASVARSLLSWFQRRYEPPSSPHHQDVRENLSDVIDTIRGLVALFGSQADIDQLANELDSDDSKTRQGAARALFPVAEGRPDMVREAIFRNVAREWSPVGDIARLLYFYTESDPVSVVEGVRAGNMLHTRACGIALTLLVRCCRHKPERVRELLPGHLEDFPDVARGVLSELLAFAWWQYAACPESELYARTVLERLSVPSYQGVNDKYRAFITYSASMAVLGRIALDHR
jgi:hypothetical protein